jgi:hypothetical protein
MHHSPHCHTQNSRYPRCVDCRPAEVYVTWQEGHWRVEKRGEVARQERGPQFPGGSLAFVHVLEAVGGIERERAFDLVEQASAQTGLGLQIHLDDDRGQRDLRALDDTDLIALVQEQTTGCGFVAHTWQDEAPTVVREAVRRGWRVQIVTGPLQATGAWINERSEQTFDTTAAALAGQACFNLDIACARPVLFALEQLIAQEGFAERAEAWLLQAYRALVPVLGAPWVAERE